VAPQTLRDAITLKLNRRQTALTYLGSPDHLLPKLRAFKRKFLFGIELLPCLDRAAGFNSGVGVESAERPRRGRLRWSRGQRPAEGAPQILPRGDGASQLAVLDRT